jgi:hypothetical protein
MCLKEKHTGKVANEWTRLSTAPENAEKFEWIELAPVLSSCMAIKDDEEMVSGKTRFEHHLHGPDLSWCLSAVRPNFSALSFCHHVVLVRS